MKKIGIITLTGYNNYGNRLQCYALSKYCNDNFNADFFVLKNYPYLNNRRLILLRMIKHYIKERNKKKVLYQNPKEIERTKKFLEFEKNIKYYPKTINAYTNLNMFDYLIVGSDQIWNPNCGGLRDVDLLKYVDDRKKISYSASFGLNNVPIKYKEKTRKSISSFKCISVREERARQIIEELTCRKDTEVLIDPTMLLTSQEWDKVTKKPDKLTSKKYILNYFLGNLSNNTKNEIERIAKENNCDIINILDVNDPFYASGPAEFLYLEKNAFLICTDSFHASVFSILYNRPFVVFEREGKGINMNSRIDTLLTKFKLNDRKYNGENITQKNIEHDYSEAYKVLDIEREKSKRFLKSAIDE